MGLRNYLQEDGEVNDHNAAGNKHVLSGEMIGQSDNQPVGNGTSKTAVSQDELVDFGVLLQTTPIQNAA